MPKRLLFAALIHWLLQTLKGGEEEEEDSAVGTLLLCCLMTEESQESFSIRGEEEYDDISKSRTTERERSSLQARK